MPFENLLVVLWVSPLSKVTDVTLVDKGGSPVGGALEDGVINADRKKDIALLPDLSIECCFYFVADPSTFDRTLGEDEEEFVLHLDSLVNALVDNLAWLHVVWGKPARHIFVTQIDMELLCDDFIRVRITDE